MGGRITVVREPRAHPPARSAPTARTTRRPRRVPAGCHRSEPQKARQAQTDDRSRIAKQASGGVASAASRLTHHEPASQKDRTQPNSRLNQRYRRRADEGQRLLEARSRLTCPLSSTLEGGPSKASVGAVLILLASRMSQPDDHRTHHDLRRNRYRRFRCRHLPNNRSDH